MNRTRALLVSLAVGLAAIAGVFALGHTLTLGHHASAATDKQVARRTAQLDRYEASLRKALKQKPPALPALPAPSKASTAAQSVAPVQIAAPVRVIYHRPPPIVVVKHRTGGEHEQENEREGVEADD